MSEYIQGLSYIHITQNKENELIQVFPSSEKHHFFFTNFGGVSVASSCDRKLKQSYLLSSQSHSHIIF